MKSFYLLFSAGLAKAKILRPEAKIFFTRILPIDRICKICALLWLNFFYLKVRCQFYFYLKLRCTLKLVRRFDVKALSRPKRVCLKRVSCFTTMYVLKWWRREGRRNIPHVSSLLHHFITYIVVTHETRFKHTRFGLDGP